MRDAITQLYIFKLIFQPMVDIDSDLMVTKLEEMNIQRKLVAAFTNNNNVDKSVPLYHQLACVEQHYLCVYCFVLFDPSDLLFLSHAL